MKLQEKHGETTLLMLMELSTLLIHPTQIDLNKAKFSFRV